MKIHRNCSLKKFNTFSVDEKAQLLFEVDNISDIPNILSNVELYIGYKKHVSKLPQPLEHPKYLSSAGMKGIRNKFR